MVRDEALLRIFQIDSLRGPGYAAILNDVSERKLLELIDFRNMEEIRARVDQFVVNKSTAEALKPWYGQMCKRPCFHDDYLPTFNRENVTLVDTAGMGVQRITPKGIVAGGVEYPVDTIVFASGFEVSTEYWRRLGFDPVGSKGVPMSKAWANGPSTLHGIHARGFPNMLLNSVTQGGQAINFSFTLNEGDLCGLIGPNGAGKSNFLAVFDMLGALVDRRLGVWFGEQGGPSRVLFGGLKRSQELRVTMKFEQGRQGYEAVLGAADGGTVFFVDERAWGTGQAHSKNRRFAGIAARRLEPRPVPVPAAADRRPVDSPNPGRGAHRRAVLRRLRAATRRGHRRSHPTRMATHR